MDRWMESESEGGGGREKGCVKGRGGEGMERQEEGKKEEESVV